MSAKILPAIIAGLLLGTTPLASAQALVFRNTGTITATTPLQCIRLRSLLGSARLLDMWLLDITPPDITATLRLPMSHPLTSAGTMPGGNTGKEELRATLQRSARTHTFQPRTPL
jgi:hypothetical protein